MKKVGADPGKILEGIKVNSPVHLTICNPPFYSSIDECNENPKRVSNLDSNLDSETNSLTLVFRVALPRIRSWSAKVVVVGLF